MGSREGRQLSSGSAGTSGCHGSDPVVRRGRIPTRFAPGFLPAWASVTSRPGFGRPESESFVGTA